MIKLNQRNDTDKKHRVGDSETTSPSVLSVYGFVETLIIPKRIAFDDPADYMRAIAAWRYNLDRQLVRIWEGKARGLTATEMEVELSISKTTLETSLNTLKHKLGVKRGVNACTLAGLYGLGLD